MPHLRRASRSDVPVLAALIERSVRVLHLDLYTPVQIELALAHVFGVDTVLVDDGTYFAVEDGATIVACGGWSKRATLHGGDQFADRPDHLLDPATDAAKIRAFFVRPGCERRGLASLMLERCEYEARAAGFARAELSATLAGVPFYAARGYAEVERGVVPLTDGESMPVVLMERRLTAVVAR